MLYVNRKEIQKKKEAPRIISPVPRHYLPRAGRTKISLELRADPGTVSWYVNGVFIGKGNRTHDFEAGKRYIVRCASDHGTSEIRMSVGENPISSRMNPSSSSETEKMTPSR